MRIDLHVHSTASDGTRPPGEVMARAAAAGLDVVALTDHDTTAGWAQAQAAAPSGLTLLPGAEISCAVDDCGSVVGVHLLAYAFDPDEPALAAELLALRDDRRRRATEMVDRLRSLGAPVEHAAVAELTGDGAVGRPHIARALVAAGVVPHTEAAFSPDWIGEGGRAWVAKHALVPADAIALVRQAGGVTVFAHPAAATRGAIVGDEVIAAMAAAGLDGLEVDHPDHDAATRTRLRVPRLVARPAGDRLQRRPRRAHRRPDRLRDNGSSCLRGPACAGAGGRLMAFDGKLLGEVFATLIVIMDPLGTIPVFLGLTTGRTPKVRRKLAGQAVGVAFLVISLFAVLGRQILVYLGITVPALQAAGGLLLILVALELLTGRRVEPDEVTDVNVALVPLGTPLLAGPGAIVATIVFVRDAQRGAHPWADYLAIAVGVILVHLVLFIVLRFSVNIIRLIGESGIVLLTRIFGLLLSAIAVQLVANAVRAFIAAG